MQSYINRPHVPAVTDLHLAEDRYIVHDVAALRLPRATGTIRRHVGPDGEVTFTGHVDAATPADWIDDTTQAADAAEAWAFVVRELDAARAEHQRAIFAAKQRHPAGSALGGAR
ncbi:hypothetical protein MyChFU_31330 [Mycobacterium intracellulare subsp. chimaera]